MIAFGRDVCGDWDRATSKEWLETNGLGGYASSTIVGANTRRYHGLLIAALRPPTQRTLLLSKLEETLVVGGDEYDLSCNQYPGAVHPQGYRYLAEFRLDPFPTFVYETPAVLSGRGQAPGTAPEPVPVRLEKTVAMCQCLNGVIVRYRLIEGPAAAGLVVRPIVNCRDHHHLMRQNASFGTGAEVPGAGDLVSMQPFPGVPPLRLRLSGARFEPYGYWFRGFEYAREQERGLDYAEDQYSPGYFSLSIGPGESRYLVAWLGGDEPGDPAAAMEVEIARRRGIVAPWAGAPQEIRQLVAAADAFLVSQGTGTGNGPGASPHGGASLRGVIAGYHWFEEWGRDTMIALPGLTLVTGRFDAAKAVLRSYIASCSEGMIPNRIPDADQQPDYNTVDATLWMFWAAHKCLEYTNDEAFVREELLPALVEIIQWHVRGTRYGIRADGDGLLRAGSAGMQLTWMDAKVGEWVVTPRHGKPVEINALWHHALRFVEELGAEHAGPRAEVVAEAFRARFWNEQAGYLNDVVDGEVAEDASLRPNQVIPLSLPYPILDADRARRALATIERELLTPYGLRTLSPGDPRYRGKCTGDQWTRDGAYHQGTVWPWLLGPFITAYLNYAADQEEARRTARAWVEPIFSHLREAGLGQVSEIFDGDAPHEPRGCIAQAWSVAEVLRAVVENLGIRVGAGG
ncbi:MAG: amylo-alpha-1,6-glucosidase [Armatimonadota bacterium]